MKVLVSKWEIKKFAEQYPNFFDCPLYVMLEGSPVLTIETAKRLEAAVNRKARSKPKAKKK